MQANRPPVTDPDGSVVAGPVVSAETAGLGNRIKSWVSAMRLADEPAVYWPVTANMPATFGALFTNACEIGAVPSDARVYRSWRLAILPEDESRIPRGFATVGAGANPLVRGIGKAWWKLRGRPDDRYRYMVFPKTHSRRSTRPDARHLDLEYGRIPQAMRDIYAPLFARIEVQPAIASRVADWREAVGIGPDTVGVQIRTWRDDPRRHAKYHRTSFRRLLGLMDREPQTTRFLGVSDDDEVLDLLAQRYGQSRLLRYPRETSRAQSWTTPDGIVEDLIDMLLLTAPPRLFASYLSTFSETAWWLGGARAEVTVF